MRGATAHPADVARWVEILGYPTPAKVSDRAAMRARKAKARSMLTGYGLDDKGQPVKAVTS